MPKEKYDPPDPRRIYTIMSAEEVANGKKSHWAELEISGELIWFWILVRGNCWCPRIAPDAFRQGMLLWKQLFWVGRGGVTDLPDCLRAWLAHIQPSWFKTPTQIGREFSGSTSASLELYLCLYPFNWEGYIIIQSLLVAKIHEGIIFCKHHRVFQWSGRVSTLEIPYSDIPHSLQLMVWECKPVWRGGSLLFFFR